MFFTCRMIVCKQWITKITSWVFTNWVTFGSPPPHTHSPQALQLGCVCVSWFWRTTCYRGHIMVNRIFCYINIPCIWHTWESNPFSTELKEYYNHCCFCDGIDWFVNIVTTRIHPEMQTLEKRELYFTVMTQQGTIIYFTCKVLMEQSQLHSEGQREDREYDPWHIR